MLTFPDCWGIQDVTNPGLAFHRPAAIVVGRSLRDPAAAPERKAASCCANLEKAKGAPGPGREKAGQTTEPAFTNAPTLVEHGNRIQGRAVRREGELLQEIEAPRGLTLNET